MSSLGSANGEDKGSRTEPRIVSLKFILAISFLEIGWFYSHVNLFPLSLTSISTNSLYSFPPLPYLEPPIPTVHSSIALLPLQLQLSCPSSCSFTAVVSLCSLFYQLLHGSCYPSEADRNDMSCEQVILWLPFITHSV